MKDKFSRRRFFIDAALSLAAPRAVSYASSKRKAAHDKDSEVNPEIVTEEDSSINSGCENGEAKNKKDYNLIIDDLNIKGQCFRLAGVAHSRDFAKANFNELESLVKSAGSVILEASPVNLGVNNPATTNNAKAYFGTMVNFCRKYEKPILTLDSLSSKALRLDKEIALLGFSAACYSFFSLRKNMSRRGCLARILSSFGGTYVSFTSQGLSFTGYLKGDYPYAVNHLIDQRNIELLNRLGLVSEITKQFPGDYALVNFGKAHTEGVKYYHKHPVARKIKDALYKPSFDLIDNDKIALYTWQKNTGYLIEKIIR